MIYLVLAVLCVVQFVIGAYWQREKDKEDAVK